MSDEYVMEIIKPNKSLHWIFTPLRSVKTSEFKRCVLKSIQYGGFLKIPLYLLTLISIVILYIEWQN